MALKSYRFFKTMKKKKKTKPVKDLITGGVTALIGTAFVSQTADVLSRI